MQTGPTRGARYVVVVRTSRFPNAGSTRLIVWTIWLPLVPYLLGTAQAAGNGCEPLSVSVSVDGCVMLAGIQDGVEMAAICVPAELNTRTTMVLGVPLGAVIVKARPLYWRAS